MESKDQNRQIAPEMTHQERREALGNRLRELRESVGLSKIALAQSTRISLPFLDALEGGTLSKLPGQVFGRGFIRNICKQVGADPDEFLEEFDYCWDLDAKDDVHVSSRTRREAVVQSAARMRPKPKKMPRLIKIVAPISVVVVAILAVWSLNQWQQARKNAVSAPSSTPKAQAEPVTESQTESVTPAEPVEEAATIEPKPGDRAAASFIARSAQFEQVLALKVNEPVRVRLKVDGAAAETKELKPGTIRYTFNERAELLVYDANALEISFNGRPLGDLGTQGRVRRLSFRAKFPEHKTF